MKLNNTEYGTVNSQAMALPCTTPFPPDYGFIHLTRNNFQHSLMICSLCKYTDILYIQLGYVVEFCILSINTHTSKHSHCSDFISDVL